MELHYLPELLIGLCCELRRLVLLGISELDFEICEGWLDFSNPSGAGLDLLVFMRGMSFCEVSFAILDGCRGVYIDDESLRKFFFFFSVFHFPL